MSVFNPSLLPPKDYLSTYGVDEITTLADFYGKPAEVEFEGVTNILLTPSAGKDLLSEWKILRRTLLQEIDTIMKSKLLEKAPGLQELLEK